MLGTHGDFGCFSFFSNKNLSTGEGGLVCTHDDAAAARLRLLRSHGMTTLTLDRHRGHSFSYDVVAAGYNYRIDEIRAALGRVQLAKLEANNARRHAVAGWYGRALADAPGVRPLCQGLARPTNHHVFPALLPQAAGREALMRAMRERGVQTSIHYNPVHAFTYYREQFATGALPLTEEIGRRELTLPMFPQMTEPQVERVVAALRECLACAKA